MPAALDLKTLLRCFARTYVVSAAYNTRGLQNIGFVHAMNPGLIAIHQDGGGLYAARGRYVRHGNCHPFLTPFLVGAFLHMEQNIAAGQADASLFLRVKDVSANTLSAIGDSVFSGSALTGWALSMALFALLGEPKLALVLTLALFMALQLFKLLTFFAGLRYGLQSLGFVARWGLINWGDNIKMLNAVLVVVLLAVIARPLDRPWIWLGLLFALPLAAEAVGRVHFPRIIVAAGILAAFVFWAPGAWGI